MIYLALNHIVGELNQFLGRSAIAGESIVVLSNPVESDGRAEALATNKVVVFLAGIERDTTPGRVGNSRSQAGTTPTYLNLYVMVAANFTGKNYSEALRYISDIIGFFQLRPVFERQSSPSLDPGIEKLILDMENVERRELNNIWGMFGGKYMPSVLYRMRMLTIDPDIIGGRRHIITEPAVAAGAGLGP